MSSSHQSPVTRSAHTVKIGSVDPRWLIREYDGQLHIDVSRFMGELDEIGIFRCEDTGYQYYHPFIVAGDAAFYNELQRYGWYYMAWKWEHETALRFITPQMKVLEIGCGEGAFLRRLDAGAVGLELNERAALAARAAGADVLTETIESHARHHRRDYDLVCSFQVLEHISQVHEFITSSVEVLQPGGFLIISVPNNDSIIFRESQPILNYPPHHMGMWTLNSLLGLQQIAAIRLQAVFFEPLQPYHLGYATDFLARGLKRPHSAIARGAAAKFERIFLGSLPPLQRIAEAAASEIAPYLPGHSVLLVFVRSG